MRGKIKVPAEHIVAVARVIEELGGEGATHQGVKIEGLHLLVEDGRFSLNDKSGTYGSRRWPLPGVGGVNEP